MPSPSPVDRGETEAMIRAAGLMYHDVGDSGTVTGFQRPGARTYRLGTEAFRSHLDAIAAAGVRPARICRFDPSRAVPQIFLTFDDGGASALQVADLLSEHGWLGHFFIVTARIGMRGFLDRGDIRDLHDRGHLIGSHSHSHPDIFRDLSPACMLEEWRTSRAILADLLGEPCLAGSVPGGDSSPAVFNVAAHAGFRYLFTSEPWTKPRRVRGCWVLGRAALKAGSDAATAARLAAFQGWAYVRFVRTAKDILRYGLSPLYRQYVRHRTVG